MTKNNQKMTKKLPKPQQKLTAIDTQLAHHGNNPIVGKPRMYHLKAASQNKPCIFAYNVSRGPLF